MIEAVTLCECDCMQNGELRERQRIMQFLREKKVLRDSFFLNGLVIYTEHGAIDITEADLKGKND